MRPVPRIQIECQRCHIMFGRMACQMKHKPVKYCSRACKYAAKRRGQTLTCGECSKDFYSIRREHLKLCSRACLHTHQRRGAHSYPKIKGRHAHRVVMEKVVGRPLGPNDIVHHKDENKLNYSEDNLELTNRPEHFRMHFGNHPPRGFFANRHNAGLTKSSSEGTLAAAKWLFEVKR